MASNAFQRVAELLAGHVVEIGCQLDQFLGDRGTCDRRHLARQGRFQ